MVLMKTLPKKKWKLKNDVWDYLNITDSAYTKVVSQIGEKQWNLCAAAVHLPAIPGDRGSAVFRRSIKNALGVADSGKLSVTPFLVKN